MKKELKERWVAALRSGDYVQSQGCLQDEYGWCCLGVLCNIVDGTKWIEPDENVKEHQYDFGNEVVVIDMPPMDWLENHGLLYGKELAEMNDDVVQFTEIAEYIKENVNVND